MIELFSLLRRERIQRIPRWKRLLLEELMVFFATSELTTYFKAEDDPVVIRLEHVDLANETCVEIFNLLVRRDSPLQIDP